MNTLAKDLIDDCTRELQINRSMLAALINVTESTLNSWDEEIVAYSSRQGKIDRLKALHSIIYTAIGLGHNRKIIVNVLNEPIPGSDDGKSLLYYVVDEPNNSLINTAVLSVLDTFE